MVESHSDVDYLPSPSGTYPRVRQKRPRLDTVEDDYARFMSLSLHQQKTEILLGNVDVGSMFNSKYVFVIQNRLSDFMCDYKDTRTRSEAFSMIVDAGFDLDSIDESLKYPLLFETASYGFMSTMLGLFIENDVNVLATDANGWTYLHKLKRVPWDNIIQPARLFNVFTKSAGIWCLLIKDVKGFTPRTLPWFQPARDSANLEAEFTALFEQGERVLLKRITDCLGSVIPAVLVTLTMSFICEPTLATGTEWEQSENGQSCCKVHASA